MTCPYKKCVLHIWGTNQIILFTHFKGSLTRTKLPPSLTNRQNSMIYGCRTGSERSIYKIFSRFSLKKIGKFQTMKVFVLLFVNFVISEGLTFV